MRRKNGPCTGEDTNMSTDKLKEVYDDFIKELEEKKTGDRMETYSYILTLWRKLSMDLQTWKMILDDMALINNLDEEQLKIIFKHFREAALALVKGSRATLDFEEIQEILEKNNELMKKRGPSGPLEDRMVI